MRDKMIKLAENSAALASTIRRIYIVLEGDPKQVLVEFVAQGNMIVTSPISCPSEERALAFCKSLTEEINKCYDAY